MSDDLVKRIKSLGARLHRLQQEQIAVSGQREELIRQLRAEGWSYGRIAEATGLSRGRVAQIVTNTP